MAISPTDMAMTRAIDDITVDDLNRDPYPVYARLRRDAPVCFVPALGAWLVTRWAEITEVAAHPEIFGPPSDSPLRNTLGENVLTVAGDAHKRLRSTMEAALRRQAVSAYAPELVARIAEPLLRSFQDDGMAELMSGFFEPVAVRTLAQVLGLQSIDTDTLRRWFRQLAIGGSNYEHDAEKDRIALEVAEEIDDYAIPIIERLRGNPDESLLSAMVNGEPSGGSLTTREVLANLKLILLGGMQEPGHAAGNIVWSLLTHPEQAALVASDPESSHLAAVEEGLRWLAPVGTATREVAHSTDLGGVRLEPGQRLAVVLSSGNRDESRFTNGEIFDILRTDSRHRAFGIGGHFCVGHWLARHEISIPVRMAFEQLANLRLDVDRPTVLSGWEFRGPVELNVRWDVDPAMLATRRQGRIGSQTGHESPTGIAE